MAFEQRFRPGAEVERKARECVLARHPGAVSAYTADGAIVYDDASEQILGRAADGDWAVEFAWIDAARIATQN